MADDDNVIVDKLSTAGKDELGKNKPMADDDDMRASETEGSFHRNGRAKVMFFAVWTHFSLICRQF